MCRTLPGGGCSTRRTRRLDGPPLVLLGCESPLPLPPRGSSSKYHDVAALRRFLMGRGDDVEDGSGDVEDDSDDVHVDGDVDDGGDGGSGEDGAVSGVSGARAARAKAAGARAAGARVSRRWRQGEGSSMRTGLAAAR
jgi:hypothetical protein